MSSYCSDLFPDSCRYRALRIPHGSGVRDSEPDAAFPWSERHLRCVWADPAYRPSQLFAMDGRRVIVENPGRWNLEAGPDFLDAILRTAPDEAVLRGDIELHIRPADWRHHGHAADRRYRQVIAHVTYFDGTLPESDLPPSILQIALRQSLKQVPSFSFDSLDLPAYPYATLAPAPPCAVLLKHWNPEQRVELLESAGEERLRLKTARLGETMSGEDPHQILYVEIMGALGYKQNRLPFQALAHRLPLSRLQQESAGNPLLAYALLMGVSGLLPVKTNPLWDEETRQFVRLLWDFWWKRQVAWLPHTLSQSDWNLSNIRPVNNPLRRLMAASELFTGADTPLDTIITACQSPEPSFRHAVQILQSVGQAGYWAWRNSLAGPRQTTPMSLIGAGRAATLMTNVLVPWMAANRLLIPDRALLERLPTEDDNRFSRHTAHALFGHDHNPVLYRSGLRQQGLLQIFHDFCLNSKNGCRACPFPEAITRSDTPSSTGHIDPAGSSS